MLVKNEDQTKMEEGEYFAIETFGSTGRGRVVESVCAVTVTFTSKIMMLSDRVTALITQEMLTPRMCH